MKRFMFIPLLLLTMAFFPACQERHGEQGAAGSPDTVLAGLLPAKEGFTWYYNGFAEYGHRMTLDSIENQKPARVYKITGMVDDPSGGEAKNKDFRLQLNYVIENGTLVQEKKGSAMLDSEFDRLEIIKGPLEKGAKWMQQVKSRDNETVVLECAIEDVGRSGEDKIYTVSYRRKDSDYYEKRVLKEGVGVLSFEKLLHAGGQKFPAGYSLNEEASGYESVNKESSKPPA